MCHSLSEHPIVDPPVGETVPFTFDGQPLQGKAGLPIAAALLAAGISIFRTTQKKGQPRSLFCGIGQCNDCVVVVNGQPNIRSCVTLLVAGMIIETQQGLGRVGKSCL